MRYFFLFLLWTLCGQAQSTSVKINRLLDEAENFQSTNKYADAHLKLQKALE